MSSFAQNWRVLKLAPTGIIERGSIMQVEILQSVSLPEYCTLQPVVRSRSRSGGAELTDPSRCLYPAESDHLHAYDGELKQ